MSNITYKHVYYLRAIKESMPLNLENLIKKARSHKPLVRDTEILFGDKSTIRIQHYNDSNQEYTLVHLTKHYVGETASSIQANPTGQEDTAIAVPPPQGHEFKDGDCFILLDNFHAFFCGDGISLRKTSLYFTKLLIACGYQANEVNFDLNPTGNLDRIKFLKEHGAKSIQLNTNLFDISDPSKNSTNSRIPQGVRDLVKQIVASMEHDDTKVEQKVLADLLVNVEIRLDGNTKAAEGAQISITDIAEDLIDDLDSPIQDISIITKTGEKITPSEIRLQKSYRMHKIHNSIDHYFAWKSLVDYYKEIKEGGLLER